MTMKWRKSPETLMEKFTAIVPHDPAVEQRKMFGYPAAFVGGNLFMSLFQDSLVLRLSETDRATLLSMAGASAFEPMPGRPMREYVTVPPAMLEQQATLAGWIRRSLNYAKSLPAKGARRTTRPGAALRSAERGRAKTRSRRP